MVTAVPTSMTGYLCAKPTPLEALRLGEIAMPAVPDDGVLVRVRASSVNPVDAFPTTLPGYFMAGRKPVVLGTDFAGVVEAVGSAVTRFRPGDEVFGGARGAF
ncbi:MAG TPA: alcohol dehydrogenase catalytic domain-containing protein, partial [Candidatus Dormibacteraeota bacterium]|nr:alcohol dehydrogenase catalytic domain-containing protein [Candidatus Dormibacteraeota bacterium]